MIVSFPDDARRRDWTLSAERDQSRDLLLSLSVSLTHSHLSLSVAIWRNGGMLRAKQKDGCTTLSFRRGPLGALPLLNPTW